MESLITDITTKINKYTNDAIKAYIDTSCVPSIDESKLFDNDTELATRICVLDLFKTIFPDIKYRMSRDLILSKKGCGFCHPQGVSAFVFTNYNFYLHCRYIRQPTSLDFTIHFSNSLYIDLSCINLEFKYSDNKPCDLNALLKSKSVSKFILPIVIIDYLHTCPVNEVNKYFEKVDTYILSQKDKEINGLKINNHEADNIIAKMDEKINALNEKINALNEQNSELLRINVTLLEDNKNDKLISIEEINEQNATATNDLIRGYDQEIQLLKDKIERQQNEIIDITLNNKRQTIKLNDIIELYEKLQDKICNKY